MALLNELKVPPVSTTDGSKFHRRVATSTDERQNWSVLQRGITNANSPRAAEGLVLRAATKLCRYSFIDGPICDEAYKANTRHWPAFCALNNKVYSNATFLHCEQLYPVPKWDSADDIHMGTQYFRLDKIYALKQLLSTRAWISNSFPAQRTAPRLLAAFDTISCKWVSNIN